MKSLIVLQCSFPVLWCVSELVLFCKNALNVNSFCSLLQILVPGFISWIYFKVSVKPY